MIYMITIPMLQVKNNPVKGWGGLSKYVQNVLN